MAVSVVIPTYNSAAFLRETLASVFAETRRPDEIVVVDDASVDDTRAIVARLAANAPVPLRWIELPRNTGAPARPMNVGIETARGDVIALFDHDDLMLPRKLELQLGALERRHDLELVLGDYETIERDQRRGRSRLWPWQCDVRGNGSLGKATLHVLEPNVSRRELAACNLLGCSCSNYVFRKTLWQRLGGFSLEAGIASDWDFLLRASDREIGWLDAVLFVKRFHGRNLWQSTPQNVLASLRLAERWLRGEAQGMDQRTYDELRALSVEWPVACAWDMHRLRRWDDFDRFRRALSGYADVPCARKLLVHRLYPRWLYTILDLSRAVRRRFDSFMQYPRRAGLEGPGRLSHGPRETAPQSRDGRDSPDPEGVDPEGAPLELSR